MGLKVAVIVNDIIEVNIDSQIIQGGGAEISRKEEKLIEMSNGCICCTLRDDLLEEVKRVSKENRFDYLLIESTGVSEPMPVAETFFYRDDDDFSLEDVARLDTLVTVVDAANFENDFGSPEKLKDRKQEVDSEDERTIVDLMMDQIEFANVIVLNKIDTLEDSKVSRIVSAIKAINSQAELILCSFGSLDPHKILDTGLFNAAFAEQEPDWLKKIQQDPLPETEVYGICSFVFRARRPFHPKRLWKWMSKDWPGVIRSKGFFWLATRMDFVGLFSRAGAQSDVQLAGKWFAAVPEDFWPDDPEEIASMQLNWEEPFGDRRQELVIIGYKDEMDPPFLTECLEACLLTKEEMQKDPGNWNHLTKQDPFPEWISKEPSAH